MILAFAVIVGAQGREIKALKSRVSDMERKLQDQQQVLGTLFDDFVSRLPGQHVEPQDCGPCFDGYDPTSGKFVRIRRREPARGP